MSVDDETASGTIDAGKGVLNCVQPSAPSAGARGWYSRGYLPHFDAPNVPQMVTFRLVDSLPSSKLAQWQEQLSTLPPQSQKIELYRRIEDYLDRGHGSAVLKRRDVGGLVQETFLRFDGERYALHAWVVMPNHVHALLTVADGHELAHIMHSWKSFTASAANRVLGRSGVFWQREYFDRYVRNERHFHTALGYIEENPVAANLCARSEEWQLGSAKWREDPCGTANGTIDAVTGSAGTLAGIEKEEP